MSYSEQAVHDDGYQAGKAAGSWVIDGNTSTETCLHILNGYEDGDPEVMDMQPSPLSGEWADEPLPRDILERFDLTEDDDEADALLTEWEEAYSVGFWHEVQHSAIAQSGATFTDGRWTVTADDES